MNEDVPLTAAETLLQTYLERPLSRTEQQQLAEAALQNSDLVSDAALIGLLRELRLERRISTHEDPAWQAFSKLTNRVDVSIQASAVGQSRWRNWVAQLWLALRPALPAMAMAVVLVQAVGLVLLSSRQLADDGPAMRGGPSQTCPAVQVRFKSDAAMADVSRALTQAQASIVNGPDRAGYYRLMGPINFVQDAGALLQNIAGDIQAVPDCTVSPK